MMTLRTYLLLACFFIGRVIANEDNVAVVFDKSVDLNDGAYVPVVLIANNEKKDNVVYLSYSGKNQQFVFTAESRLYKEIADALSQIPLGLELTFSCKNEELKWCDKYHYFELKYDFYRSELSVFYSRKEETSYLPETSPLIVFSNDISYSFSKSHGDVNSTTVGFWSSAIDLGMSNDVSLHTDNRYDLGEQKFGVDNTSIRKFFDWGDMSLFYNQHASHRYGFSAEKFVGIKLGPNNTRNNKNPAAKDANISNLIITASGDGIFNIYDRFRELKQTTRAVRGLNNILLNGNDFDQGIVTIDVIQNGNRVETIDRVIDAKIDYRDSFLDSISLGGVHVTSENNVDEVRLFTSINYFFEHANFNTGGIEGYAYFVDSNYDLPYGVGLSSNIEYQYQEHKFSTETRIHYDGTLDGWRYSPSTMYKTEDGAKYTALNFSLLKPFNEYLLSMNYNWQIKDDVKNDINIVTERLDSNITSVFHSSLAKISWSVYGVTNLINDHGFGLSMTITPTDDNKYIKPTLSASYSKSEYQIRAVNEVYVNDSLTLLPEVSAGQKGVDGYGVGAKINNDYLYSDLGAYRTPDADSFNANMHSNLYLSSFSMMADAALYDSAIFFENENSTSDSNVEVNVNGVNKKVHNRTMILSESGFLDNYKTQVYPLSEQVDITESDNDFYMPRFRVKKISFKTQDEKLLVYGRVINGNMPAKDVTIRNGKNITQSDSNGYFQLLVNKSEPNIVIFNKDKKCNDLSLKENINLSTEVFIGRLKCNT